MTAEIIASLFAIAKYSLSIVDNKQSRKYLDRIIYLEKVYYYEENKPEPDRDFAVMDNCINELCLITQTITRFKT